MKRKKALLNYERKWALAMSLPGLTILVTFVLLPLLLGFWWSFSNKRLISPIPTQFIGFKNYKNLLSIKKIRLNPLVDKRGNILLDKNNNPKYQKIRELIKEDKSGQLSGYLEWFRYKRDNSYIIWLARVPSFWRSLFNTLRFVLVIVPCQGGLALLLALLVNTKIKGEKIFRTIFFAPVVTSMAVISIVWIFILNPNQGLLNNFLSRLIGKHFIPIRWLIDKRYAPISIYLVSIWQSAGFQMIIFLAGLQGIPEYLYESAYIDGANKLQSFKYVTFPMLKNTTIFVIISTTILAFRVFTQIDVMTKGGPQESTSSLIYYIVQKGFREQRIGYASAVSLIFFLIVLLVSMVQKLILHSEKEIE